MAKNISYMKPLNRHLAAALMICAAVLTSSCRKDDPEQPEKMYTLEELVLPLTWDKFRYNDDVIIEKPDTSSMIVSESFIDDVVKKEIVPGLSYLAVWLKSNQHPFYRLVTGCEDLGDGRLRLSVERADVSCCLPPGEYTLNTDLYRNAAEEPRIGGAGGPINGDYYFDPINREYHPVAIFTDGEAGTPLDENDICEINFELLKSPLVEDYFKQLDEDNWSINPTLTISLTTKDKYFGKEESAAKIGIQNATLKSEAGFKITLDVGTHWKKKKLGFIPVYYPVTYLNEFAVSSSYSFSADYAAIAEIRGTKKFGDDYVLFKCKAINSVFWLGPVPLLVSSDPEFIFRCKGDLTGGVGARSTGKMEINEEHGIRYKDGKWRPIDNSKPFKPELHTGFDLNGKLSGSLGLLLKIPLKFDKLAGPYLSVGGQVDAGAEGTVMFEIPKKSEWPTVDFKAKIDFWAGAELGAEIQFMKWKLASSKVVFKLFNVNLLTWPEKKTAALPGPPYPLPLS